MKFLYFINVLDPDHPQLSPVRIQAWTSTIAAVASLFTNNDVAAGVSIVWAAFAHGTHIMDKRMRALNARAA